MKLSFSKKDKLILLFGILLLILLIVFAQLALLSPIKADVKMKEQSLKTEKQLLDTITQDKVAVTQKVTEDTRELQKNVPVTPLQEQFILDLEKAENVSNSKISSMGFSKDADVILENTEGNAVNGDTGATPASEGATKVTEVQDTNATGLKKLTVSLSVESPNYEDLETFVSTLESLKRIVVIESINYTGGEEITTLEAQVEPLSYSLTVSAYYLPTLEDLLAELPKIDAPAPANKKNPLTGFSDTTKVN
ncbi:pilus assembly protein PilO [Neobacillus sp. 3P2-tot-E-2]|uniref:pilus assembly protein PilO n=1 Tax=Neobacillus sp. 3P2-tot-E-2 TaxID=3132212 RepID=UPI00399FBD92